MRNMLRRMSAVIVIALSASCMVSIDPNSSDEGLGESAQAHTSCSVDCDCPLGWYCSEGICLNVDFGPPPEWVTCYGSCQCQSNEYCQFHPEGWQPGKCVPLDIKSCGPCPASKDCHCGDFCWPKKMACP
ncbi:hypothetical protein [Sorangium sp. So ce204]|uniref:hypothetical protein n=1 Tax=Sorangium sp. So ce204 TaxID=3133288 RepID=UPI003F61DC37